MDEMRLEQELLLALRRTRERDLQGLADAVGLPRTNFGRSLSHRLDGPIGRLLDERLIEEQAGRYRLSERGRQVLAERALEKRGRP